MSTYGKNHYNIVISLQLIKINEKNSEFIEEIKMANKYMKKLNFTS